MSFTPHVSTSSLGVQAGSVANLLSAQFGKAEGHAASAHLVVHQVVDAVSFSPEASLRLVMDAPDIAIRQLGLLLKKFEQSDHLNSDATPHVLGGLAAEIGAAAHALGNGVHVIVPYLEAIASRPIEPVMPIVPLGTTEPITVAVASLSSNQHDFSQPHDQQSKKEQGREQHSSAKSKSIFGNPRMPDNPARQLRDAASSVLHDAAGTLERIQLRLREATVSAHYVEISNGNNTKNLVSQRNLDFVHDAAWGEANIALALAQIAHAQHLIAVPEVKSYRKRRMFGLIDQHGSKISYLLKSSRICWELLPGALCVVIALWLTSQLDLGPARIVVVIVAVLGSMSWIWKKIARWQGLRIEIQR